MSEDRQAAVGSRQSEDRHTEGPWDITGISQDTGSISVGQRDLRIVIADVTNAASFADMLAGAIRRGGDRLEPSDAQTQFANARLIAAAPDLLHAIRLRHAYDSLPVDRGGSNGPKGRAKAAWLAAEAAAIAKAEGRS